jgi:cytochrome P450
VLVPYNTKGSLVHMIDPVEHSKRRRLWDRAFTPGAIKSYEPMLQKRLSELVQNLNARSGSSLDLGHWMNLFSFDFMGDFAFGGRYNMMSHGRDIDGIHDLQMKYVGVLEALGSIPWIRPLVLLIPAPQARRLQQIARNVAEQRRNDGSQTRDLFYHLVSRHSCATQKYTDTIS